MVETHGRYRFVVADDETKVVPAYEPSTSEVIDRDSRHLVSVVSSASAHRRADSAFRAVIGAGKNDTRKRAGR